MSVEETDKASLAGEEKEKIAGNQPDTAAAEYAYADEGKIGEGAGMSANGDERAAADQTAADGAGSEDRHVSSNATAGHRPVEDGAGGAAASSDHKPNGAARPVPSGVIRGVYPTWGDLLTLVGVLVFATLFASLLAGLLIKIGSASTGFAMFVGYVVQFSLTILFALWQKLVRGGGGPLLPFSIRGANPAIILWGVLLTFATSVVIEPLIDLFPAEQFKILEDLVGMGGWMMLTTVIMAPILEEILFRGIIQESVTRKSGPVRGVLVASLIFGAAHYSVPPQAVNAFFVSLVLGYIYSQTRSLLPVIVIHMVNNAIAYFTMVLAGGRMETTRSMIRNDTTYRIVYAVAVALFIIACVHVVVSLRRLKKAEKGETLSGQDNNPRP